MMPGSMDAPGAWSVLAAVLAWLAGVAVGLAYFGSIWWQVHAMVHARRSLPWALGSSFLRIAMLAAGLMLVARGGVLQLLAAALGLWVARAWALRRVRGENR